MTALLVGLHHYRAHFGISSWSSEGVMMSAGCGSGGLQTACQSKSALWHVLEQDIEPQTASALPPCTLWWTSDLHPDTKVSTTWIHWCGPMPRTVDDDVYLVENNWWSSEKTKVDVFVWPSAGRLWELNTSQRWPSQLITWTLLFLYL